MTSLSGETFDPGDPVISDIERATMAKVAWRVLPVLMLCFAAAVMDRANVSFASLTMNQTLGFSRAVFGFGTGIFFLGYAIFEIPSNLILNRVGARLWIARIMLTWGIVSASNAFVWNGFSFYGIRFLLGVAEAGFYPGVILYLTWWFPGHYRARAVGLFMAALAGTNILSAIISGPLLALDGIWGLHGWQWLFLLEGIPPVILGVVVLVWLVDRPADARWLSAEQRDWLQARITSESRRDDARVHSFRSAVRSPLVWVFVLIYFSQNVTGYGLSLFLPQILSRLTRSSTSLGFLAALPYVFGLVAMLLAARYSDRSGRRTLAVGLACLISSLGLAISSQMGDAVLMLAVIAVAHMGQSSIAPTFWPLPTAMMTGTAAAGGIALINSVGNLGGFVGPYLMGLIRDRTGSFAAGLLVIAGGSGVAVILIVMLARLGRSMDQSKPGVPAV